MSLFHIRSGLELRSAREEGYEEGFLRGKLEGIQVGRESEKKERLDIAGSHLILDTAEIIIPKRQGDPEGYAKKMEDIAMIVNSEQYPSFRYFLLLQIADFSERAGGQKADDAHVLNQVAKYLRDLLISLDQMKKPPESTQEMVDQFS